MQQILKAYLRRLTNLTANNKSLLLTRPSGEQFFDLHALDFLLNKPSFSVVAQLMAQQPRVPLCATQDSRYERVNEASKHLRRVARTAAFIEAERGAQDLYVGYPMVRGKLADGTLIHAPLLFFAVSLRDDLNSNAHPLQPAQEVAESLPSSPPTVTQSFDLEPVVEPADSLKETLLVDKVAPVPVPKTALAVGAEGKGNRWWLQRRDEPVTFNRAFLLAYAHFNRLTLPEELVEKNLEELDKEPLVFRTQLYELLKASPLEINFNQELFTDQLQAFPTLTKDELEKSERNGELKLYPQAVLGIFPQAGSYLAPDYEFLLDQLSPAAEQAAPIETAVPPAEALIPAEVTEPAEAIISAGATTRPADGGLAPLFARLLQPEQSVREEFTFTAFAMDGAQERALRRVKAGQSLVVQGPPGTGKSQLISNLITDFTARGKRVLLVCQKRAALDVVYARLREAGMADFVALLHDFQNDRRALYAQLHTQLTRLDAYRAQNQGLDAVTLERTFAQESRRIDKTAQELQSFRDALFDDTACGLSVKELYLTSSPAQPHVGLKKEYKHLTFGQFDAFLPRLRAYALYAHQVARPGYPWLPRVSFHRFAGADLPAIEAAVQQVPALARQLADKTRAAGGVPFTIPDALAVLADEEKIIAFTQTIENDEQWDILRALLRGDGPPFDDKWLDDTEKKIAKVLKTAVEETLPADQLATAVAQVLDAQNARVGWLGWTYWRVFSPHRRAVASLAAANRLSLSAGDLRHLAERLEARQRLEKLRQELPHHLRVPDDLPLTNADRYRSLFHSHRQAAKAHRRLGKVPFLRQQRARVAQQDWREFGRFAFQFLALLHTVPPHLTAWSQYLTKEQVDRLLADPAHADALLATLRQDFDWLCEADRLHQAFSPTEETVVAKLLAHSPPPAYAAATPADVTIPAEQWQVALVQLAQNSLRLAWIDHLEDQHPVLRAVSSPKLRQLERELQDSIRQKQELSRAILLLKLRERTYRFIEFNRLQNATTYRELTHQVTKKRNVWPVRKLMGTLAEEVFSLVPCWMASPEAVSAIFPMQPTPLFDLVIFDEASQCFAENGIPAIHRARQVVITGDSKQLPPADLYRVRFDDAGDEEAALEVDALLDLAAQYLPTEPLTGHYRSRSLDLIDFSNRHFYQNTLQLLPDFRLINARQPAIRYVKVEGTWENNANPIEAQAVVELVESLLPTAPSLGIVTFNYRQQNLIQDLLEARAQARGQSLPPEVFVKNIENVQGDERDVIVFSVGYAPDARGKLTMNFGSLNAQGGENRLNVAITRARERVYVVSSLLPAQLRTDTALHDGPKLLKAYLEYAWQVSAGNFRPQPLPTQAYRADWLLKDKLTAQNPQFRRELPFADLTIKDDDTYQALLLTDDDLYYQSLSAKEAHAYTPFALQEKNWNFRRVYSREFWKGKA